MLSRILLVGGAVALISAVFNYVRVKVPRRSGAGLLQCLVDADDYAKNPVSMLRDAAAKCGNFFSIQVLSLYMVWMVGNEANKGFLETKEDHLSLGFGLVSKYNYSIGNWPTNRGIVGSLAIERPGP